jgi:hypothetical protein
MLVKFKALRPECYFRIVFSARIINVGVQIVI